MGALKNKTYEYKVYTLVNSFVQTIARGIVASDVSFTKNTNGGVGQMKLQLNVAFDYSDIGANNLIEIKEYDEENKSGRTVYKGIVTQVDRIYKPGIEFVSLTCVGLQWLLNKVIFESGGFTFTKNQEPKTTVQEIIDHFNTRYGGTLFNYTGSSLDTFGSSISRDYEFTTCIQALNDLANDTGFYWYVSAEGVVIFKQKPATATHKLTIQKHIDELILSDDHEDIVNEYNLTWKSGIVNSDDATSQTENGYREKYKKDTVISSSASAQITADEFIIDNKDEKRKITLTVNSSYDIESIEPGDTVTIENTPISISNLQVKKVRYNGDVVKLDLELIETLAKEILNN
jgi:hypothetical protein